jgi:hypothetical protein
LKIENKKVFDENAEAGFRDQYTELQLLKWRIMFEEKVYLFYIIYLIQ